jgi:3-oxoacyl-[acyl-carrier-protein] synthase III
MHCIHGISLHNDTPGRAPPRRAAAAVAAANSRVINPDEIKTYPLFADGAGAILQTRGRPDQGIRFASWERYR